MGYFVVHPGGQQYGPAEISTLNQWAAEGRLIPDTPLIDAATGAQMFARDVPGLFFPMMHGQSAPTVMPGSTVGTPLGGYRPPQPTNTPYGSNYPRQTPLSGPGGAGMAPAITGSYIASAIGLLLGCCVPFLGILAGLVAVGLAASANRIDPARARGAIWLGIATIIVGVLLIVGFMMLGRFTTTGG